ncbi:MAG: hypothetical protein [Caudoviricetes sp.]|nr:MAG: hypothetical protein [Caudoviricetes sp.]
MKHADILREAKIINDKEYITTIENTPPDHFVYEVIKSGGYWTLKEKTTGIIIFKSFDETYTDETCDVFNVDKDAGKDALLNSINTNYR